METNAEVKEHIIEEWRKVPETQRRTATDAFVFGVTMSQRFSIRSRGDPAQAIKGWIIEYQVRCGQPLEDK